MSPVYSMYCMHLCNVFRVHSFKCNTCNQVVSFSIVILFVESFGLKVGPPLKFKHLVEVIEGGFGGGERERERERERKYRCTHCIYIYWTTH